MLILLLYCGRFGKLAIFFIFNNTLSLRCSVFSFVRKQESIWKVPLRISLGLSDQWKLKHDSYQERVAFQLENICAYISDEEDMEELYHAMLQIHNLMHKVSKSRKAEKSFQSSIPNWVLNLPFDTKIKEWLVEEEKYKQELNMKNILPAVADKFLTDAQGHRRGASVLCFDEIQTVDVFAIVALSGIVSRLLITGTVLVATSNRAPRDLNQDGMQKEIFEDLLARMEEHCENVLIGSEVDYGRHIAQNSIDQARTEPSVYRF